MKAFLVALLLCSGISAHTQAGPHSQEGPAVHSPSPSSVDAGDYIYISSQGPRNADGASPATFAAQVRQALTNLKSVVETAGLTMDHVVYTTFYLTDIREYEEMNHAFAEFFRQDSASSALSSVLPDFLILQLRSMPSPCAISRSGVPCFHRTTSRMSPFRREFSLTIGFLFLRCQPTALTAIKSPMIRPLR